MLALPVVQLGCEEWPSSDNEPASAKLIESRKRRFDIGFRTGLKDVELKSKSSGCHLHLWQQLRGIGLIGWAYEQSHSFHVRDQLMQKLQPLRVHLYVQRRYAGDVATRSVQARDQPRCDRITPNFKDDRDRGGSRFRGLRRSRAPGRDNR